MASSVIVGLVNPVMVIVPLFVVKDNCACEKQDSIDRSMAKRMVVLIGADFIMWIFYDVQCRLSVIMRLTMHDPVHGCSCFGLC